MDHVVYVDAKADELERLLSGEKCMIIRGAAGRKMPYDRVHAGDTLYLIKNNAEGAIRAKAQVKDSFHSEKLTAEESTQLVAQNQAKLQLTEKQMKRWAGKRYLVLVEVDDTSAVEPFAIDKSGYGNMDDWLLVYEIENVKLDKVMEGHR